MSKKEDIIRPKVFISYSWTPENDKEWVKDIADRLVKESGIDVMLDRYDLKPGDDKYTYMERMVGDETISKVLIFSNQDYTNKANKREGGVGTESTIISQEVYGKVTKNKFIPILLEKNDKGEPCLPTFIRSKIHFDFSNSTNFEDEYEKLVRFLYDKPLDKKPVLGPVPSFILETDPIQIRIHYKLERFRNAVTEGKRNVLVLIEDYLETFIDDITQLKIEDDTKQDVPFDELVYQMILKTKVFRDDFLEFFEWMLKLNTTEYIEILHNHVELWDDLITLEHDDPYDSAKVKRCSQHYKFLFKELFLYMNTIALQKSKFDVVKQLVTIPYWVRNRYGEKTSSNFSFLSYTITALDKDRLNRLYKDAETYPRSIATNLLVDESRIYKKLNLYQLQETERVFYYLAMLNDDNGFWFPYLTMYRTGHLSLMKKAESKVFFDKIKPIFQVNSVDELKVKINKVTESKKKFYVEGYSIDSLEYGLNIDNLATK